MLMIQTVTTSGIMTIRDNNPSSFIVPFLLLIRLSATHGAADLFSIPLSILFSFLDSYVTEPDNILLFDFFYVA